jgi:DNA-binding NtrC family response regulator
MSDPTIAPKGARILLVDDQPANLEVLCSLLAQEGYQISMAPSGQVALKIATGADAPPDLILLDVMMPDMDGFETCRRLKEDPATRDTPVIFITAADQTEGVLAGFRAGAIDYVAKPFRAEEVLVRVQTQLRVNQLARELAERNAELVEKNRALEEEIAQRRALKGQLSMISELEAERWGLEGFIGESATIQAILKDVRLLQGSAATSVLIVGESGTGKELIARAIHHGSARAAGSFVPLNCAAIPGELVESLLFGHVRGAFTGADADRMGYFEMAHGGTVFLDEIGDMLPDLQAKLLRVLEDGEIRPVGGSSDRTVDVRVVAATNVDLENRIAAGAFRQDLYFRLARFTVSVPPIRERKGDIPLLARHFLQLFAAEMGREAPTLSAEIIDELSSYHFPGNVRELKNIIERALIESDGAEILPKHLHFLKEAPATVEASQATAASPELTDIPMNLAQGELWLIRRALAKAGGNISETARLLGTHRNRIYRALAEQEHAED